MYLNVSYCTWVGRVEGVREETTKGQDKERDKERE
jgi:hypothetical protein